MVLPQVHTYTLLDIKLTKTRENTNIQQTDQNYKWFFGGGGEERNLGSVLYVL